ncbi:TetR/AcrR family transcriptional regulator [Hydrocarboniphaga sp.]|uniref:TetR/AcrR family transcriptional regulator n=1 Tax=Hydrocarboniphaga sp. TaxID=2033016 RepID=UPI003D1495F4
MAKNKRTIDREIKRDEIDAAASRLFIQHGYEATSMSMIAAAIDVAPNTLYWYYKSKDEMLVGALNRLVAQGMAELHGRAHAPFADQLSWAIQQFAQASDLVSTVHARAARSEVVREWHEAFHRALENMLVGKLQARGLTSAQARLMATVGTFVVEGLLSHPHTPAQRSDVIAWMTGMKV